NFCLDSREIFSPSLQRSIIRRIRMIGQKHLPRIVIRAKLVAVRCLVVALIISTGNIAAEQLPVRTYTTADGLPRDLILRIVRDSHGFLWFCTAVALSRFNGYEFTY